MTSSFILTSKYGHLLSFIRGFLVASCCHFSDNRLQAAESWVLFASLSRFSGTTVVFPAAEDKPNGCSVESDPGYLGSMTIGGPAQWDQIKLELAKIQIRWLPYCAELHYTTWIYFLLIILIYTKLYKINNANIFTGRYLFRSGFGGLGVACWPLVPKFAGSNPAEAVGLLGAKKSSARLPSEGN